jgi:Putative undecaprenyl diphosphate synthase
VGSALAHVMVVGGTRRDWADMSAADWAALVEELGAAVADAGGAWLTVRAYEPGQGSSEAGPGDLTRHAFVVAGGRCTAMIDPQSDGRERFAEAMRQLPAGAVVDEKAVAHVLYEPADVEPDLVMVLGPPTRLPPSLVWELAYGELVFSPRRLADLTADDLREAVEEYNQRQRRFGGLDS